METLNEAPSVENFNRESLRIAVDPIHSGLRIAVFGSFFGAGFITFVTGFLLFPDGAFIAILLSAATAAGTSMGLEHYLKNRWPSGREFLADSERIAIAKHDKIESVVDATQHVNVITWRFEVKKDGPRAKKGWQLLGMALEQNDSYVVIYSAASPEEYVNMPLSDTFTKLERTKEKDKSGLSSSSGMRRAGEQKRLMEAEIVRQFTGGDMLFDDFVETIEFLQRTYPDWMITG